MGAWVLLLFITTAHLGDPEPTLSVTPIYFQTEDACKLVAAKLATSSPRTGRSAALAYCYSTATGAEAR
jgi:hypothetical protein